MERLYALLFTTILCCTSAFAKAKVVVIDTGIDLNDIRLNDVLCPTGHRDLTGTSLLDNHGHGTHIVSTIREYAGDADYCIIMLKWFSVVDDTMFAYEEAFLEAIRLQPDVMNLSLGGYAYNPLEHGSLFFLQKAQIVAAAGNENRNIERYPYYPAMLAFSNITVVGSLDTNGKKAPSSNYGNRVSAWEIGTNIEGLSPRGGTNVYSGTSIAAAIYTGKLIKKLYGRNK